MYYNYTRTQGKSDTEKNPIFGTNIFGPAILYLFACRTLMFYSNAHGIKILITWRMSDVEFSMYFKKKIFFEWNGNQTNEWEHLRNYNIIRYL